MVDIMKCKVQGTQKVMCPYEDAGTQEVDEINSSNEQTLVTYVFISGPVSG